MGGTSRMTGDGHVRICERPGVKLPRPTRLSDDVDVLALSLHPGLPLWSNDRGFDEAGIEYLTTAQLLAMFFGRSPR